LTAKVYPDISTWSDLELVNTKKGRESLWIVSSSLLSEVSYEHNGDPFQIQPTMVGVDIDVDSDEFREWYHSFTRFYPAEIFEAQHNISKILNKYFEESNQANHHQHS
jgi:hypothetical protein